MGYWMDVKQRCVPAGWLQNSEFGYKKFPWTLLIFVCDQMQKSISKTCAVYLSLLDFFCVLQMPWLTSPFEAPTQSPTMISQWMLLTQAYQCIILTTYQAWNGDVSTLTWNSYLILTTRQHLIKNQHKKDIWSKRLAIIGNHKSAVQTHSAQVCELSFI